MDGDDPPCAGANKQPSEVVTVTGMTGGKAEKVYAIGHLNVGGDFRVSVSDDNKLQKLKEYTQRKIESNTKEMVKVSAMDKIVQKLQAGRKWITITGNPGEGKTTLGYMVLKSIRSEDIYQVDTPEELSSISKLGRECIIMLNDIFGLFTLDLSALNKWMPHIAKILDDHETAPNKGQLTRVIFISRWNILQSAKDYLERYHDDILNPDIVNLSKSQLSEERLKILNYHLKRKGILLRPYIRRKVANGQTSYGFPHCCKIFSELNLGGDINIEQFFKSPLSFLNATTKVLMRNSSFMALFKNMIRESGLLDLDEIIEEKEKETLEEAATDLDGSYITLSSNVAEFAHPSIYESVVNTVGEKHPWFIVRYASVSVILQMVNIKENGVVLPGFVNIDPKPKLIDELSQRFLSMIHTGDFSIFGHRFCDSRDFCQSLMKTCVHKGSVSDQTVEAGNVNYRDRDGITMLFTAVKAEKYNAVRLLVENGADVNIAEEKWDQQTALHHLCKSGKADVSTVQLLITADTDVDKADKLGWTPLHHLCFTSKTDVSTMQLLIGDVNKADVEGRTPLHLLCWNGKADVSTVHLLMTEDTDVNKADGSGKTPLHYLCSNSHADLSAIQVLITNNTDVNKADNHGMTPLHNLCTNNKVDLSTIQLLITDNKDVNKASWEGRTPLHYMCANHNADVTILELLITADANVNITDAYGMTPLHILCRCGKADVSTIQLLIRDGTDVNKTDMKGRTPLHYLCTDRNADISAMQLLITDDTDINKADVSGTTPLHLLCDNADVRTMQFLIRDDTDVNKPDLSGRTPLHFLCHSCEADVSTIQLLIRDGTDVNKTDMEGRTPLHNLCWSGVADVRTMQLLITSDTDVNKTNVEGRTALHYLCQSGGADASTVQFLIAQGADVSIRDLRDRTAFDYLKGPYNPDDDLIKYLTQNFQMF